MDFFKSLDDWCSFYEWVWRDAASGQGTIMQMEASLWTEESKRRMMNVFSYTSCISSGKMPNERFEAF